jgi:hypothetical protein
MKSWRTDNGPPFQSRVQVIQTDQACFFRKRSELSAMFNTDRS